MGYGENKKNINNFIKKNNITTRIKVMGFNNNPYKYIKKSDFLILTSI